MSRPPSWTLGFLLGLGACAPAQDRGATVLYASGADLQSINPLLTVHPLARQVQRFVLLTTVARYDSALVPQPYLARDWSWSADKRTLRLRLVQGVRWDDGVPTTAGDVRWTLDAARDPIVGYPRLGDLAGLDSVLAPDDSTVVLGFSAPQARFPDVLTDLAILPAHLLDSVPRGSLRRAEWNQRPVGNGPFRFVRHEPNRRWVFAANPDFPATLGGPPGVARLVIAVVDEPVTKLAALVDGELDFAGIQPAHAAYVRRDPRLQVLDYPLLFTYGLVFNLRRAPFDRVDIRRRISNALDRRELVEGYVYGYGTPATGPVPPGIALRPAAYRVEPERTFELLTVGSGEGALEQMVQAQLARAGFQVTIRQLELSAFLDRLYGPGHDFDAAILGIPGDLGLGYLGPLASLAGMTVPRDPVAAERMFADSVPVAFLYHARGLQGMNRRVHGVRMDVRGELVTVHDWRIER